MTAARSTDTSTGTDTVSYGVTVWEWVPLIRRARISLQLKGALLALASYAAPDGSGIHCGVARLAVDCQTSYRTAGRYLAWARSHQLIALVRRGNRRRGRADEYRLIAGPDLHRLLDIPAEEAYRDLIAAVSADNRESTRARQRASAQRRSTDTQTSVQPRQRAA